jgi:hypothetical protein
LAVINSALFLWCISAAFLTLGGGYAYYFQPDCTILKTFGVRSATNLRSSLRPFRHFSRVLQKPALPSPSNGSTN